MSRPQQAPMLRHTCEAVLIDFGGAATPSSRFKAGNSKGRPGARHIRAPEVVLGLSWDFGADLWSLGCVLASLYTGMRLFRVHDDMEHLASMERFTESRIPSVMGFNVAPRIADTSAFFDYTGRLEWPRCALSEHAVSRVQRLPTLRQTVLPRH